VRRDQFRFRRVRQLVTIPVKAFDSINAGPALARTKMCLTRQLRLCDVAWSLILFPVLELQAPVGASPSRRHIIRCSPVCPAVSCRESYRDLLSFQLTQC
jgi:hypothetical protein